MNNTILNKLQTIFQNYFDAGLYPGITATANRVSTGELSPGFSTPHVNIIYTTSIREPYATSNMDRVRSNYEIRFLIKPAPNLYIGNAPKIKEITDSLNTFAFSFLDRFIKENKLADEWFTIVQSTDSELKQYAPQVFYITATLTTTHYDH